LAPATTAGWQGAGRTSATRNYIVRGGHRVRKDTKTHQDRWLAIDPDTCALVATYLDEISAALAAVGVELRDDAYLFSNDPSHARPWNPDWVTHQIAAAAEAAGVDLDIKDGRHYTASQAFDDFLDDLAARGCRALGYRLSGPTPVDHMCVKHLRGSLRVVVAFEEPGRAWILLVSRHDGQDRVLDVYAELYRLLGVEPPTGRTGQAAVL
jgi:hypothetical protein